MMKLIGIVVIVCISMVRGKEDSLTGNNGLGRNCNKVQPCSNGGTCGLSRGGFFCKCPTGLEGYNCQQDVDECANSPCKQGTCENTFGSYTCICPDGWTGSNCQTATSKVFICAGGKIQLRCSGGQIDVLDVVYGRTEIDICPSITPNPNTDCELETALEKVQQECQGNSDCVVQASNSFFMGEPCAGTQKYLYVNYQCLP